MSKDKNKEVIQIGSKLIVKTFLHDDLQPGQHDRAWEDGRLYLMLDPDNEAIIAHGGIDRVIIDHATVMTAFEEGFCNQKPRPVNRGRSRLEVTVIVNEDTNEVRIYAKLFGVGRDSPLPDGRAVYVTNVTQIGRCLDVQKLCLPLAGRAYRTLRNALYRGAVSDIDLVERGLTNRLEQLAFIARCKHDGMRDMLKELIATCDAFYESVVDMPTDQALDLGRQYIAGGSTLTGEIREVMEAVRARIAEMAARKERAIVTVADLLEEKERMQQRRKELQAKRAKRAVAHLPMTAKGAADKIVEALGFESDDEPVDLDDVLADPAETESDDADDREAEGSPEVPPAATETPKRNAVQERMFRQQAEAQAPAENATAPEAPKPTVPPAKKVEAPKLDWKAKLDALKANVPAGTETAPAADVATAPETDKSE